MRSRRQFIQLALTTLIAAVEAPHTRADTTLEPRIWLPMAVAVAPPPTADAPIVGPASGSPAAAERWLRVRCSYDYTPFDVAAIVERYRELGVWAGVDWFLALAQMAHETGSLTSWWSQRPRRNPAGIGVTGRTLPGAPTRPPGPAWAWDSPAQLWREGVSFPTWNDHAIPAHLGRLLAYSRTDATASAEQRQLIDYALMIRPLPAGYRGVAPMISGLDGRWAVPGVGYGARIVELAGRMRLA
jgi:hypothetical protein